MKVHPYNCSSAELLCVKHPLLSRNCPFKRERENDWPLCGYKQDLVLVYSKVVGKPGFPSIKRRELAYNDIGDEFDDFTRLHIPIEVGDEIRIYRRKPGGNL